MRFSLFALVALSSLGFGSDFYCSSRQPGVELEFRVHRATNVDDDTTLSISHALNVEAVMGEYLGNSLHGDLQFYAPGTANVIYTLDAPTSGKFTTSFVVKDGTPVAVSCSYY